MVEMTDSGSRRLEAMAGQRYGATPEQLQLVGKLPEELWGLLVMSEGGVNRQAFLVKIQEAFPRMQGWGETVFDQPENVGFNLERDEDGAIASVEVLIARSLLEELNRLVGKDRRITWELTVEKGALELEQQVVMWILSAVTEGEETPD